MITLPPGVVSLKAAWLYHSNSALPWALAAPRQQQAARDDERQKMTTQHAFPPLMIFRSLAWFFRAEVSLFRERLIAHDAAQH